MSQKKKSQNKTFDKDFTIDDYANAPQPVRRIKKCNVNELDTSDLSWDQLLDDDLEEELVVENDSDDAQNIVCNDKECSTTTESNVDDTLTNVYPEIVWYLISKYVKPEDIGHFAGINKSTYMFTKRESFWRSLYKRYCKDHPKLPEQLRLENGYHVYGLRQRVIRALYHTYDVFVKRIAQQAAHDSKPHELVKRRCVNVWFSQGIAHWFIYFKFKKLYPQKRNGKRSFIEELGRIDANPEEDAQVLQVTCQSFCEVPPLMGTTLSSVSVFLSQGFRYHKLHLGFNTGYHNVSRDILPEYSVVLDTVVNIVVFDWWHPKYPHFDNKLPSNVMDEESLPVLKKDFFSS